MGSASASEALRAALGSAADIFVTGDDASGSGGGKRELEAVEFMPTAGESVAAYVERGLAWARDNRRPKLLKKDSEQTVELPVPGQSDATDEGTPAEPTSQRPKRKSAENVQKLTQLMRMRGVAAVTETADLTAATGQPAHKTQPPKKAKAEPSPPDTKKKVMGSIEEERAASVLAQAGRSHKSVAWQLAFLRRHLSSLASSAKAPVQARISALERRSGTPQTPESAQKDIIRWPSKEKIVTLANGARTPTVPSKLLVSLKSPKKSPEKLRRMDVEMTTPEPGPSAAGIRLSHLPTIHSALPALPQLIADGYEDFCKAEGQQVSDRLGEAIGEPVSRKHLRELLQPRLVPLALPSIRLPPSPPPLCPGCARSSMPTLVADCESRLWLCFRCQEPFTRFLEEPLAAVWSVCGGDGKRDGRVRCKAPLGDCEPCWFWHCVRLVQKARHRNGVKRPLDPMDIHNGNLGGRPKVRYTSRRPPDTSQERFYGLSALPIEEKLKIYEQAEEDYEDEVPVALNPRRAYIARMMDLKRQKEKFARDVFLESGAAAKLGEDAAAEAAKERVELPRGPRIPNFSIIPSPKTQLELRAAHRAADDGVDFPRARFRNASTVTGKILTPKSRKKRLGKEEDGSRLGWPLFDPSEDKLNYVTSDSSLSSMKEVGYRVIDLNGVGKPHSKTRQYFPDRFHPFRRHSAIVGRREAEAAASALAAPPQPVSRRDPSPSPPPSCSRTTDYATQMAGFARHRTAAAARRSLDAPRLIRVRPLVPSQGPKKIILRIGPHPPKDVETLTARLKAADVDAMLAELDGPPTLQPMQLPPMAPLTPPLVTACPPPLCAGSDTSFLPKAFLNESEGPPKKGTSTGEPGLFEKMIWEEEDHQIVSDVLTGVLERLT